MAAVVDRQTFALPRAVARVSRSSPSATFMAGLTFFGRCSMRRRSSRSGARGASSSFSATSSIAGPTVWARIELASGAGERIHAAEAIVLTGNHEAMMRLALDWGTPLEDAIDALAAWLHNGGAAAVGRIRRSRRPVRRSGGAADPHSGRAARAGAALARIPAPALALPRPSLHPCRGRSETYELDAFLETPWSEPLAELEEDRHWAWVRWPFLEASPGPGGFSGLFVVHGHTPNDARPKPSHADQIRRFRLNLDAGSGSHRPSQDGGHPRR